MTDLFGQEIKTIKHPDAYAGMPGSGPKNKKCKTCDHRIIISHSSRSYNKCELVKQTRGEGTDIKVNSPACWRYKS